MSNKEKQIQITGEIDIAKATYEAMTMAEVIGFGKTEQYMISTAVSELARNIVVYAMKGEVIIRLIGDSNKGIEIIAIDKGSGIEDLGMAMKDHFSTSEGLGLGLPGVKRLMDEFRVDTKVGRGTKITVRKWV